LFDQFANIVVGALIANDRKDCPLRGREKTPRAFWKGNVGC
jgi:hypothetical protein